ncbi:MAG TPA: ABC transporter ATP-binding protein [Longimicrobiales bacterium]|nr:ABC transporter ATP-binding protein [Longimicrobiales bacterium]
MTDAQHHEEEALGKAYDARLMRRLLGYLRPYRGRVVVAILILLGASLMALVGPWLTQLALDRAIPEGDTRLLGLFALAFLASLIVAFILEYAQTLITTWLGQRVMYDLRREIFGHLQKLELRYYDRNPVGRLMTRVTSDVEVLNELFSSGVVTVFGDVFTLLFITGAMLIMDWQLALVTMLVIPLVFVATQVFRARVRNAYRDIRVRLARINAFLQERITGMSIVQLFGRERETSQRFRRIDADYLDAHLRSITYYAIFFPVIELLTATAFALIISYGGAQILGSRGAGLAESGITVGVLAAFLQWARRFFQPIQDLSEKYNMLQGAMASSERIFGLLDTEPPPATYGPALSLPGDAQGRIEFRDVWFAYGRTDDGEWDWVLRGISFTVEPGQRLAVVGHTGAGKTSLISLLMRFYEPQRGEILFDGVPIRQVDPRALRDRIALVLQDVFLFSRDIAYNIRLGEGSIDDERVAQAAQRVGADAMIRRLPHAYAEPLGERGASLSVGERQLLSFARALAFDPLVLVLDEATSSVDSALEARIEQALDTLMHGRTSIVIAHRLSTVQNADRILVLHHGELREQGTHAELLERGGLYARLYELQFVRAQQDLPRAASS